MGFWVVYKQKHIYFIMNEKQSKMINDVLEIKVFICAISISSAIFIIAPLVNSPVGYTPPGCRSQTFVKGYLELPVGPREFRALQ